MRKIFICIGVAVVLASVLFFYTILKTNPATSPETIIGEVTHVSDSMLTVKEDMSQIVYEFNASPDKLKDVKTGYRVEVETANEKVPSLTVLGMPQADAELYRKWDKVINTN